MSWQPIPNFTAPHYLDTNLNQVQKCVNWYHEKTAGGYVAKSVSGFQSVATAPNAATCRGAAYDKLTNFHIAVHGSAVYLISAGAFAITVTGSMLTSSGDVVIAVGGSGKALIVDGTYGYIVDINAHTLTQITDSNFAPTPISCTWFNAQFIAVSGASPYDRWYMSAVDDGLTWTPLISGRDIYSPDATMHAVQCKDLVYFLGQKTIETWAPTAVDPYLQPISGAALPIGIGNNARHSVASNRDSVFLYGLSDRRGSVYRIGEGGYANITPPYIQDLIGDWQSYSVYGACYSDQGQEFYEVHYSDGGSSSGWLYNISSDTWSQVDASRAFRAVFNTPDGSIICFLYNSASTYSMGTSSAQYNQYAGSSITRVYDFKIDGGISRTFNAGLRFELEAQHDSSSSYTLSFTLQKSDDGGRTFDTGITVSRSITNGTSAQQVLMQTPPLGSYKAGRIYRATFTGPAARLILRRADGLVTVGRF